MGITYVGGQVGGRAGATSTLNVNYALTGGLEAVPRRGDLIIITVVVASQARNPACAVTAPSTNGAWSALTQLNASTVTYDTSLQVSYKFQAEVLDTLFTLPSSGNNADAQRYTVQVWRGVDPSSPFDVTSVSATGTATGRPNPASITPTTSGAYVLICGGGAAAAGAAYTAPANYATNFLTGSTADTNDAMVGSGYRAWTSGAEDPAVYTGGTTGANDSWAAYTLALRPETNGTLRSIEVGNPHNTNRLSLGTTLPDISVGVLITGWVKQMTPPAYPYSFTNRYPFEVYGTDWNIICISGNMFISNTSATDAAINNNITLRGTGGDALGLITERQAEAPLIDWIFVAWQFIMNGTDGFVMRQWLKLGPTAPYMIREFTMTLAETRTRVGNGAFNFSAITNIGIGGGPTGDPEPYNMTRVRIYQRNSRPTESELSTIAYTSGYDTSAWADYPLTWQNGAGDFTDHSGNSRPTLTQVGYVVGGHAVSTVPYSATGNIIALQSPMHEIENATGTSITLQFETVPTAGNLITVEGGMTGGTPAVVDSESNNLTVIYSSPSNGHHPFIAYIVMPAGAAAPYSVTISGYTSSHVARARAYEWDNVGSTPLDWSKTSTSLADPLTITADSADTRNGTLVISSFMADTSWSDWPIVPPANWLMSAASATAEGTDNIGIDLSPGGQSIHRIFPTAATESITYPTQPTAGSLSAVMAGFTPSTVLTHATTGVLTGQGSVVVGSAARTGAPVTHATTGALAGQAAAIAGTAAHIAIHTSTGALTAQGSVVAGTAARSSGGGTPVAVVDAGAEAHSTSSVSSITSSVTVGSGANLLVVFTNNIAGVTCTGVTHNGVALTSLGYAASNFYGNVKRVEMWVLENPTTGAAYNLVATFSGAQQDLGFTWQSFSGYGSLGTFYTNTSPVNTTSANGSLTVSDWASGRYSVGSILVNLQTITAGDTEMGNYVSAANNDNHVSTAYQTADGNLNWTHASDHWAACGCAIIPSAGFVTHTTTGALAGQVAALAGTAAHIAIHPTTGVLTGQASSIAGAAARFRAHATSGALTGQASAIVGSAARSAGAVTHDTSGVLPGQVAVVAGASARFRAIATSGVLTGQGSTLAGAAARFRAFSSSGNITGPGSVVAGTAAHVAIHQSSGSLVGIIATLSAGAARFRQLGSTGSLVGQGSTIGGAAAHVAIHQATGVLVGPGATIVGSAVRGQVDHVTTGTLAGQGSAIAGTATYNARHSTSGVLAGQGAQVVGVARRNSIHASTGALIAASAAIVGSAVNESGVTEVNGSFMFTRRRGGR